MLAGLAACGERFTQTGGDHNPLHCDPAAAKASRLGEITVQGGITSAILHAVAAESLPGPGTFFLNVKWGLHGARAPRRGDGTVVLEGTAICSTTAIPAGPFSHCR